MRKVVTELIGTFLFVLAICSAVFSKSDLAPIAIGAALMINVYAGGHISGGHFNPAVSLAAFLRGRLTSGELLPYMGAQIVGAVIGALVAVFVNNPEKGTALTFSGREIAAALVVEFVWTFALAYVVLNVATSRDHPDNSFYGLAIGFTVLVGAISLGGISAGAFNPAVAVGISTAGIVSWSAIWIYLVANFAGGAAAAFTFKALNPEDV
jgi:aquaporin Z